MYWNRGARLALRRRCSFFPWATAQEGRGDVVYVPTPQIVVDEMLRLAKIGAEDFLIDLGSGDGRIVITAAKKYGARGFGVDLDTSCSGRRARARTRRASPTAPSSSSRTCSKRIYRRRRWSRPICCPK